ncbi:MAG: DUF1697 domain-containing protein [Rickettsiales bacterium]|jgi:uncharacterized protein (DUF1697 family)|nr:DUF1697 domain-containing protein [Rickettsiales bacterium]
MKYCAFIKQVRVHNKSISNREFCDLFERIKVREIIPVINTGNIIFSSEKPRNTLNIEINKLLSEHFRYNMNVFLKSDKEIQQMLDNLPFVEETGFYIYFLLCEEIGFENILQDKFNSVVHTEKECGIAGNGVFYWKTSKDNIQKSQSFKMLNSKNLACKFTNRAVGTMRKVCNRMNLR